MWYYMNLLFFLIIWFVSSWMWEGWEWSIHWNNRCCKSEIYGSYQQTNNAKELFSESRSKSACACAESWLFTVVTRRSLPWLSTTLVNIKALYTVLLDMLLDQINSVPLKNNAVFVCTEYWILALSIDNFQKTFLKIKNNWSKEI